jgi:hypothetical protein
VLSSSIVTGLDRRDERKNVPGIAFDRIRKCQRKSPVQDRCDRATGTRYVGESLGYSPAIIVPAFRTFPIGLKYNLLQPISLNADWRHKVKDYSYRFLLSQSRSHPLLERFALPVMPVIPQ